jgi:hypothetical protein
MRIAFLILSFTLLVTNIALGDEALQRVKIADPFIDLRTGPGDGYPIFHVIERGEYLDVILRRTTWLKVRTEKGMLGWVSVDQMEATLTPAGEKVEFSRSTEEDFEQRNWEVGVMGGDFGGATLFSFYGARYLNRGLAAELGYAEAIASTSSSQLIKVGLLMQPFSDWRVSPYFYLGTGIISVTVNATGARQENNDNQFSNVGIGVRGYISRKTIVRLEYGDYVLFSADANTDQNMSIKEWKLGLAVFF